MFGPQLTPSSTRQKSKNSRGTPSACAAAAVSSSTLPPSVNWNTSVLCASAVRRTSTVVFRRDDPGLALVIWPPFDIDSDWISVREVLDLRANLLRADLEVRGPVEHSQITP